MEDGRGGGERQGRLRGLVEGRGQKREDGEVLVWGDGPGLKVWFGAMGVVEAGGGAQDG